jgi:hypothetical protein
MSPFKFSLVKIEAFVLNMDGHNGKDVTNVAHICKILSLLHPFYLFPKFRGQSLTPLSNLLE